MLEHENLEILPMDQSRINSRVRNVLEFACDFRIVDSSNGLLSRSPFLTGNFYNQW